jgi:hypothetical protein
MQRVQWVDPSDDPNSSAVNSVGKSWNCDLLFQDSGCSCLSSLYDAGWNLMTYVRTLAGRAARRERRRIAGTIGCSIDALGRTW